MSKLLNKMPHVVFNNNIWEILLYSPPFVVLTYHDDVISALLAICAGNSPVPGEFPAQRPLTPNFDVSLICARKYFPAQRPLTPNFDVSLICARKYCKLNNREAGDLRRHRTHYGVIVMKAYSALKLVWHGWYWFVHSSGNWRRWR